MTTHKVETTLTEDGTLILRNLPFQAGDTVEVIILDRPQLASESTSEPAALDQHPLRGTVLRYDDPFEPAVPPTEWEVLH